MIRAPMIRTRGLRCVASLIVLLSATVACRGGLLSRDRDGSPPSSDLPVATNVVVPDLRGRGLAAARATLEANGLVVARVEAWPDALGYPPRTVVVTQPARGTTVSAGAGVALRVYGLTEAEARVATLEARAPRPPVATAPVAPRTSAAPRTLGGSGVPSSAAVTSSAGAPSVRVPDVVSRPIDAAASTLFAAGFSVSYLRVRGAPEGAVVAQDPAADSTVPRGQRVTLRVADGSGAADDAHLAPGFAPPPGFVVASRVPLGPMPSIDAPEALLTPAPLAPPAPFAPLAPDPSLVSEDDAIPLGPPPVATLPPVEVSPLPPVTPPVTPPLAPVAPPAGTEPLPFVLPPGEGAEATTGLQVPSFLDRTRAQARRIADDAGLTLREEPTAHGVPGRVMDQDPPSGSRVAAGATVVVRVANDEPAPVVATPTPTSPPTPGPDPAPVPAPATTQTPTPNAMVKVPSVLDRTPLVARRLLEDSGLRVREEPATRGVPGRVMDQMPLPGDDVPRGTEVVLRIPGWEPVIAAVPPASEVGAPDASAAPVEPPPAPSPPPPAPSPPPPRPPPVTPEPAVSPPPPPVSPPVVPPPDSPPPVSPPPPPSPGPAGDTALAVPSLTGPADGAELPRVAASEGGEGLVVRADLAWSAVAGAEGYLVEMEESVDDKWTPILRRVVREARVSIEIDPTNESVTYRWRVRTVTGRRGGAASVWSTVRVR